MHGLRNAVLCVCLCLLAALPAAAQGGDWGGFVIPSPGPGQPVGSYSNGCLFGGVPLPPEGEGYQVVRLDRNRYYGHPTLIDYLIDLGRRAEAAGLGPILVADLNAPRGGPLSGHASHQIGLDADIWLRLGVPELPRAERRGENLHSTLLVDRQAFVVNGAWTRRHAELIRLAASDPRVARIFIHPAIKIAMCEMEWPDRSFLRVVQPWFGHDSHMHIRLECPAGATVCEPQTPVPPGDGCGPELYSWIPDPNAPPPPAVAPRPRPPLPQMCQDMLRTASGD